MSYDLVCPFCESAAVAVVSYSENVRFGRRKVLVEGLRKVHCTHCESESVPMVFHDANLALVRAAGEESRGAVSLGMLRTLRETWDLSQKEASRLFGAGGSSFAKWEAGQSKLSTPSALLAQVALKFPIVVPYLARLAKMELASDAEGYRYCFQESVVSVEAAAPRPSNRRARIYQFAAPSSPEWGQAWAVNDSNMLEAA